VNGMTEPNGELAMVGEDAVARAAVDVLVVEVAGQRFGLWSSDVLEVLPAVSLVELAGAPAVVEGLVNVRGTVAPVLSLRRRFDLPARALDYTDHLIMVAGPRRGVVLVVDHAVDLVTLDASAIERADRIVVGARYVAGVARLADGLLVIHDVRAFLSEAESAELDTALGRSGVPET
jgi:purine-binding chemotaxis protein CheW